VSVICVPSTAADDVSDDKRLNLFRPHVGGQERGEAALHCTAPLPPATPHHLAHTQPLSLITLWSCPLAGTCEGQGPLRWHPAPNGPHHYLHPQPLQRCCRHKPANLAFDVTRTALQVWRIALAYLFVSRSGRMVSSCPCCRRRGLSEHAKCELARSSS
jgi:hypothetical protein